MGSGLRDRINDELKEAMRAQAKRRVSTLRLVAAALKERDIYNRGIGKGGELPEPEIRDVMAKMIKQRRESAEAFEKGGRPELAAAEQEEVAIIEEFLPRQLSGDEMRNAIRDTMAEVGFQSVKDMGKVMAALKERYSGQMDMAKASGLVKELSR